MNEETLQLLAANIYREAKENGKTQVCIDGDTIFFEISGDELNITHAKDFEQCGS